MREYCSRTGASGRLLVVVVVAYWLLTFCLPILLVSTCAFDVARTLRDVARSCLELGCAVGDVARRCATLRDVARGCAVLRDVARRCATLRDVA